MKRVLFIDRDGTLINEAPPTYQLDSFSKLGFYPHVFEYMRRIATELDYELVMPTNQDGLGTAAFPEDTFWPLHNFVLKSFESEGVHFSKVLIDRTYPYENAPTRKPGVGMFKEYINNADYDLQNSFVIGDRITDMQLAKNLGCKGIWINNDAGLGAEQAAVQPGRERPAAPPDDDHADVVVEGVGHPAQGRPGGRRLRVELIGPVEGDREDCAVAVGADPAVGTRVCHTVLYIYPAFLALRLAPPRLRSDAPDSDRRRCTKPYERLVEVARERMLSPLS